MNVVRYITMFIILTTVGILYDRYAKKFFPDEELDKHNLVKKYLLNESESITGKPILWLHTTYNINSRKWPSFYSRNTKYLNQPYIDLCVESIVKHCKDSFNVCLIDDDSFAKLLKGWSIDLEGLAEPIKEHVRGLALANILYEYGGMLLPNNTVVLKDLKPLYDSKITEKGMFVGEFVNKSVTNTHTRFFPSHKLMGCEKNNESMKELLESLEINVSGDNTDRPKFVGLTNKHIYKLVTEGKCSLICGKALGSKNKHDNVVLVDHLLGNSSLELCMCSLYCICLPENELLKRSKFGWFLRASHKQVLEANTEISKLILLSHGK